MDCLQTLLLLSAIVLVCQAAVTTPPTTKATTKPTQEPNERGDLNFYYDHRSHDFVLSMYSTNSCYVSTVPESQRPLIHTDAGIRDLELKFLVFVHYATPVTKQSLPSQIQRLCGTKSSHFYTIKFPSS